MAKVDSVTISAREYRQLILSNAVYEGIKPDPDTLGCIAPACKKLGCAVTDKFPCVPCAACPVRAEGNQREGGHVDDARDKRIRQLEADLHQARQVLARYKEGAEKWHALNNKRQQYGNPDMLMAPYAYVVAVEEYQDMKDKIERFENLEEAK